MSTFLSKLRPHSLLALIKFEKKKKIEMDINSVKLHLYKSVTNEMWCSIIVYGKEYFYTNSGLRTTNPRKPHEETTLGLTKMPEGQFNILIEYLRSSWTSSSYDVEHRNSYHFVYLLVELLEIEEKAQKQDVKKEKTEPGGISYFLSTTEQFVKGFVSILRGSLELIEEVQKVKAIIQK